MAARERALSNVNVNGANLAQALVTYSEGIMRQGSMLLNGMVERIETEGTGPEQFDRLKRFLKIQHRAMPQLSGITLYDREGNWLLSSNGAISSGFNSGDRAYFTHHRDDASRDIFIGPPILHRATKEWVITISRRIDHVDGKFAGVVAATLGIKNFLDLYGKIDVGDDGAISLTYASGQLLVRYPFREQDMGKDFSQSPGFKKYFLDRDSGTASLTSTLDGVERLYAFRKSESFPLITTVALGKNEALRTWRIETQLSLMVLAVLILLTAGTGWVLFNLIKRRIEAQSQLQMARQQLMSANEKLEQLASRDQLTGLANRRCFDETLEVEVRRAQRAGTPLSLILMDIDLFKLFNDTYGHVAGDECLQAVSRVIAGCARRPSDLVARYGGEELAAILPDTDAEGARLLATAMLEALAAANIGHAPSPFGRVTMSFGIACFQGSEITQRKPSIVEVADSALYRAKAYGRNRVEM
ncbi:sensor domain-containing diguanylate cyclase [Pseudomonas sp. 3A(2025)]